MARIPDEELEGFQWGHVVMFAIAHLGALFHSMRQGATGVHNTSFQSTTSTPKRPPGWVQVKT
jgi:hypothetical protein